MKNIKFVGLMAVLFICVVIVAAFILIRSTTREAQITGGPQTVSVLSTPAQHGIAYTSQEAGISDDHESNPADLAFITAIEERDSKRYITFDPVHFIDCRKLENDKVKLPVDCTGGLEAGYAIENQDKTTLTFEMTTSAGPFFLNAITDDTSQTRWRTMDLSTMQADLSGAISADALVPEYYDPYLHADPIMKIEPNLFYVVKQGNIVIKVIEKYRE